MNGTGSILYGRRITLRNPCRLYYDGPRSCFCDGRYSFNFSGVFSSAESARLWCEYHGFEFVDNGTAKLPVPRLKAGENFRVQRYASHRVRCPDCGAEDMEGRGASVRARVRANPASVQLRRVTPAERPRLATAADWRALMERGIGGAL